MDVFVKLPKELQRLVFDVWLEWYALERFAYERAENIKRPYLRELETTTKYIWGFLLSDIQGNHWYYRRSRKPNDANGTRPWFLSPICPSPRVC